MAIGKWNEEELRKRIESDKNQVLKLEENWDRYIEQRLKNDAKETPETSNRWLKFSLAMSAEYIGRCYALLEDQKEARRWFRISVEAMSYSDYTDTRCIRMLWTAVLSQDKKLAISIASKMLGSGVVKKLLHEIVKKECELYAFIILNKKITQEYLTELEELEDKQRKSISGMPPGAVKCCRGIIDRDRNILIEGLSTMLPFTRRFYGQMKGDVPVAMEEAMILVLARNAGIDVGPEDFPKYKEMLPACLFESK